MLPESRFWAFSLRLYAQSGVAEACLALQARHGIDVNLLFCCLWLGVEGEGLGKREISRLAARVRALQDEVVKPLRAARTALKPLVAAEDESLRPALGALRSAIKKSELDAEHLEQLMLEAACERRGAAKPSPDLARRNALAYLAVAGARLGPADEAHLQCIVAALPGADTAKLRAGRDRKRPLARSGQGRTI